ncbi:MAG: 2-phospho-L-lactate transferase [Candidatus Thorarchaeota archaeon]
MRVVALSGGIGGAKLALGLYRVLSPGELTIVGNTGDDIEMFGLHISPDLDIVMYTLSGRADPQKGWGIAGDTFHFLDELSRAYHLDTWFGLGDRDIATHVLRTEMLKRGEPLSSATRQLCQMSGLTDMTLLPMTDDTVCTRVDIGDVETIHFEEYFVKRQCRDRIYGVSYAGSETAAPAPGVIEAIEVADILVVCPSNPIASIGPILSVRQIREAMHSVDCPVVVVSPLVGGRAIKGPTEEFMRGLGYDVSVLGVADYYRDMMTHLVIDTRDMEYSNELSARGVVPIVTNTVMQTTDDKVRLAREVIKAASVGD